MEGGYVDIGTQQRVSDFSVANVRQPKLALEDFRVVSSVPESSVCIIDI